MTLKQKPVKKLIILFLFIGAALAFIFLMVFITARINSQLSSNSAVKILLDIDLKRFAYTFVLTSSGLIAVTSLIRLLLVFFSASEKNIDEYDMWSFKFSYSAGIIIPMLVVLSAEQFELLLTIGSFLAIFSFVIPNKFIRDKNHDVK